MNRVPRRYPRLLALWITLAPALGSCQTNSVAMRASACDPTNGDVSLPEGFCAVVVADSVGSARHIDVAENGDVILAIMNSRGPSRSVVTGGVAVLRDVDGDGKSDEIHRFGANGGNEVLLDGESLYFATDDAILRYPFPYGATEPSGPPDTIVAGLPDDANHRAKSLALGPAGALFVNIGAPSNSCQEQPRAVGIPGFDPCPQRENRAGIWRFDAGRVGQRQEDGRRFATGLRNTVALRTHPSGTLFGVVHGRDQLSALWSDLYTEEESAETPAEEFVMIQDGDDFGWPYCFFDPATDTKVLAPEYGGDGNARGRCSEMKDPLIGFPAHWAPNDLEFYTGTQFPEKYRGGAFIAFHGSWNRAPEPQGGYNVVFAPFQNDSPTGSWETFAEGFPGRDVSPGGANYRPVGVAMGPDGSLYISDSQVGRIWKVLYIGR